MSWPSARTLVGLEFSGACWPRGAPDDIFTIETLNETYRGDMLVVRQDGVLFVQQKPHGHSYHDNLPNPVPGDLAAAAEASHGHPA